MGKSAQSPSAMDDLDKPNLTEDELFDYLHSVEGLRFVTRRSVKYAVMNREIVPTRLGHRNAFSKNDGLNWIRSRKEQPAGQGVSA
ncbi:hypothetical protein [Williamsia muralis]|uniref:AlpA family transcriptional regulator n=1 Tax=Williamsia marianensis TaxID=85044 RepID=A0ABU4EVX3_WILMA|nr:hypothetical protein [Williamsia muralis]MDV7135405.1 hypothetical protein [Williamsia muralis]